MEIAAAEMVRYIFLMEVFRLQAGILETETITTVEPEPDQRTIPAPGDINPPGHIMLLQIIPDQEQVV